MPHNFWKTKDRIKPLTGKELAAEAEQLREMYHLDPSVKGDLEATRKILSDCKVSLSSGIVLERHGGDMWEDLKKWLDSIQIYGQQDVIDKMKEIEKEHGIV